MTVREVLLYPDKRLREVSQEVTDFESEEFLQLCDDLKDTLLAKSAHGLAAIQIGEPYRVFIVQKPEPGEVTYFVNPRIVEYCEPLVSGREGCLSFPTVFENIERYEEVTVTAQDETGDEFTCSLDDLEAVAVQHEFDHLDGVLFVDKVSNLKKRFMLKKLNKYKKRMGIK